jgi:glycerate 2-kinase
VVWSPATRCEVAEAPAVLPFERAAGRALANIGGTLALSLRNVEGRGGRCRGYALALDRVPEISALAADTDGIAGGEGKPTDVAGAIIDATTLAGVRHLDAKNFLHNNDAISFF